MRTITGQTILCVPVLLLFSIWGSTQLSSEKMPTPRAGFVAAGMAAAAAPLRAAKSWNAGPIIASWYGKKFQGRKTSSGDRFDRYKLTAAHRTLPIGSLVRLTALMTGRSVVVRINDRGPRIKGRDFDLSEAAATRLGIHEKGIAAVEASLVQ